MNGVRMTSCLLPALLLAWMGPAANAQSNLSAATLLQRTGCSGGVICVLGAASGEVAMELATRDHWVVHVLEPEPAAADALRAAAWERGLYPPHLLIETWNEPTLPYLDNLVDVIVAVEAPRAMITEQMRNEFLRVLRPGGWALMAPASPGVAWDELRKPAAEGEDDWSHWEHAPDNNPVSNDSLIHAPYRIQWMGLPYYIATPAITLAAGGRTFLAMGHIAHHEREEPWLNTLLARNGYNGQELWRRKLPDGYLVHRSAFIATDDTFFMIDLDGQGCVLLDPESGMEKAHIELPETPGYWKWMAMVEGILFVLVGQQPDPNQTTVVRSQVPAWSWEELSTGYYEEQIPWGFGETLLAVDINDLDKQKVLWKHHERTPIDSRAMTMGDGRLFYYCPDSKIACLDSGTGATRWENLEPGIRSLIEEQGEGLSSTPGFRTSCLCVYSPEALFFQGQTKANLVAVSCEDGKMLWHRPKTTSNPNVIYVAQKVFAGIGEEGNTYVLNPLTGDIVEDLGFRKRSCVRLTATSDSLFVRGWPEGLTRFDRTSKRIFFDGSVRPGCNDGVIGANGLLYIGPWLCDCNLSLMGTVTLTSAGDFDPARLAGQRVLVADQSSPQDPAPAGPGDWPDYRGSYTHAAGSVADVGTALMPLYVWDGQAVHTSSPTPAHTFLPTAPTSAAGRVFLAGDDGLIHALDAATGLTVWRYAAGGPVMYPPTYWAGRVYAGSADGYVYALEAATGRLLWRFRAAPVERRTMIYGCLGSVWPVNSGVLLHEGTAYFAAGIIDYEGTYVYAVDAATGDLKWVNNTSGHLDKELRKGASAQGNLTLHDGKLWMAAGNVVGMASYDLASGQYAGRSTIGDGSPQDNRGEEMGVFEGNLLFHGGRLRYSVAENVVNPGRFQVRTADGEQMDLSLGRVTPAWDDKLLVALPNREEPPHAFEIPDVLDRSAGKHPHLPKSLWVAESLRGSRIDAIALARDAVLAVCSTPRFRSLTPRSRLCVLNRDSGELVYEYELAGAPRLNGIAIDRDGRILIALNDGRLAAFGDYEALKASFNGLSSMADAGLVDSQRVIQSMRDALSSVQDPQGRDALLGHLSELGYDPFNEAHQNGAITRWWLFGPVPWNLETAPLDTEFVHEPEVELKHSQRVAGKRLAWREYATVDPDGTVDLNAIFGPHEMKAIYAYAEFALDTAAPCVLSIGSNDGFKCWFNGSEAGRHDQGRRYSPGQDKIAVNGVQGVNRVLLKVAQEGGAWAFGVCVLDKNGVPVPVK